MSDIAGEDYSLRFQGFFFFLASQFLDLDPPFKKVCVLAIVRYDSLKQRIFGPIMVTQKSANTGVSHESLNIPRT